MAILKVAHMGHPVLRARARALERNELGLLFQPKLELVSGTVIGAEAFLEWSSPDGAEIRVAVWHDDDRVRWSVTDHGPGIAAADRARLFERFFVGRNDRQGAREGVGLGLPTALAIAQAHGGMIEVDSEVGRGSTFVLVVPADGPEGGEP